MDHEEVGRLWNANADVWTQLARAGYDVYRDYLNTPAFFAMLPEVAGLSGLDIGCGEGHNTRLLARRGARVAAIDIAESFIAHARETETREPLGIDYRVASAVDLPFAEATYDFATGFMSVMDVPETDRVLAEACRVLKPGGFLQFSIAHPCYDTPHRRNLRDENGTTYAIEVGRLLPEYQRQNRRVALQGCAAAREARLEEVQDSPLYPDAQPVAESSRRDRVPAGARRGAAAQ